MTDGAAEARVTLVTVVPVEGLADWPLLELSSGDLVSDAEAGPALGFRGGQEVMTSGWRSVIACKASVLLDSLCERRLCLRSGRWVFSSGGSDIAVDATAYRDSSSEKITLGSVARLRRGRPGECMDAGESGESGDKCVSASWRFSAESGLLRFEDRFNGGGTARNGRPLTGPELLGVENADSYGVSSNSSA